MKKLLLGLALAAAGVLGAGAALAQHHHHGARVSIGLGFGPFWGWGPYWGPAWYPAPVYYPPAVVVASPPAPVQYVERSDQQPLQSGYWYYCETSRGYYPYVKDCPSGWKAVPPTPPSQ